MYKRTVEFDAFGPWIYRIEGEHTLPRLFENFRERLEPSLMTIKIPRKIERAKANPDMDLYDAVIGLFPSEILYLQRQGDEIAETKIIYESIESIKWRTCLLSGELSFYTGTDITKIQYNRVSDDIIKELMLYIRDQTPPSIQIKPMSPLSFDLKSMEHVFVNLVGAIQQENPHTSLIAYQPVLIFKVPRKIENRIMSLLQLEERIQSSFAVLINSRELIIVHRIFYVDTRSTDNYANHYYFYSLDNIKSIKIEEDGQGISILKIVTDQKIDCFKFDDGNDRIRELKKKVLKG